MAVRDGEFSCELRSKQFWSRHNTEELRTATTRGCVSRTGLLAMVFKLTKTAEQKWRKLKEYARLAQVIEGVKFKDGLQESTQRIAA
jgi:hypothetical protein